jgi:catechol 2,3-dioxygenase-like lactoylglutathione lyase family enzyme
VPMSAEPRGAGLGWVDSAAAMLSVRGIVETALYVADPAASAAFYRGLFGFPTLVSGERLVALAVADRQVLLLFRRGASVEDMPGSGGVVPGHDGAGRLHFALAIGVDELDAWRERLAKLGVSLESEVTWERGGRSLYFRDPDGHLVELATPGIWEVY